MSNPTLHIKNFSDKVKLMNQTNKKDLILSAQEARNLQNDIFDLLTHCARLSKELIDNKVQVNSDSLSLNVDGGSFK